MTPDTTRTGVDKIEHAQLERIHLAMELAKFMDLLDEYRGPHPSKKAINAAHALEKVHASGWEPK